MRSNFLFACNYLSPQFLKLNDREIILISTRRYACSYVALAGRFEKLQFIHRILPVQARPSHLCSSM